MPVYAECGGLMYLSESIESLEGVVSPMVGMVPGKIKMTDKLQSFGYKEGRLLCDAILGSKGLKVRGHEFHYSQRIYDKTANAYELEDRKGSRLLEGHARGTIFASYLHLNFLTNPLWAIKFVKAAKFFQDRKKEVAAKA
jgi:cobyrinic acid a,c-diamide synthase